MELPAIYLKNADFSPLVPLALAVRFSHVPVPRMCVSMRVVVAFGVGGHTPCQERPWGDMLSCVGAPARNDDQEMGVKYVVVSFLV